MAKEQLDTTNKLIKLEDISKSDDEVVRQLSENLQDITTGDIDAMCDEMDETAKRMEEEKKKWELPQKLKDFREVRKEKICGVDGDVKRRIEDAVKNIPVKVETESDGSRLIEFSLNGKKYKILDSKLKTHSDKRYFTKNEYTFITKRDERVKSGGMMGDDLEQWRNKKLKEYVKEKSKEGLYIPSESEMRNFLAELGKQIDSGVLSDQVAMLMYLTGMDGWYWLNRWSYKRSKSQATSHVMQCGVDDRRFGYGYDDCGFASLCMISCE